MEVEFIIGKGLETGVCSNPSSSLGRLTGDPTKLLFWLESQRGLELPEVSFTARMIPYLACLRQYDDGNRFYSNSLEQDEFGVARTLLQWRDTWYEAGWSGDGFGENASTRLLDMGTVEGTAATDVPLGRGQRAQRVLDALSKTPLDVSVTLLDPAETFSKIWQELFSQLGAVTDELQLDPQCQGESDLAVLQNLLVSKREPGEKARLKGDGSLIVLRDGSPQLSAAWITRFAHEQLDEDDGVAVLAADNGATLDDALTDAGFPRLGFSDASFWRPVFQVLPLSLELMWRPLDPGVLLQFLTHPMGPIPAKIRRPLAEVAASEPGIGGDTWLHTVEIALDAAVAGEPKEALEKKREELAANIGFWLGCERFDPLQGIDLTTVIDRVRRVSTWLARTFAAQKDDDVGALYSAALGQADELARTMERLRESGVESLHRESVRRLIEAVRGTGLSRPGRPWQCDLGKPQLLKGNSPAAFVEPVSTVVWWGCDKERLPGLYSWSRAEQASLAESGVELLPLDTQLEWQAKTWLRPILAAKDRLVLVLHDNADGHHPVFDELLAIAEGWVEERVDRVMRDPELLPEPKGLPQTQSIGRQSLPEKVRWWRLPDDVRFPPREQESFSSLEKFLYGPYQWVLNYQARIRPGALSEIEDGSRLKGSLAHELFERFFDNHPDIATIELAEAERWAHAGMVNLIEKKGAVLLMPGRQAEKEDFIAIVIRALKELIAHLQAAKVEKVDMEREFAGGFKGSGMRGTIDLIATNTSGEIAVVDIKWGGFDYRRESLAGSSYLQLAVYAQLAYQEIKQWPALGYFIVRDARMLMLDSDYFPDAVIQKPENGESLLEFWQRVERTWQWRRRQLEKGLVEVTVTDTQPDESSNPGEHGLAMPETFDVFDDYTMLTGWGDRS